jgi:hypothetical protein
MQTKLRQKMQLSKLLNNKIINQQKKVKQLI